MTRQQDREAAVKRALDHHGAARANPGIVFNYSPPYTGRPKWLITLRHTGTIECTLKEAEAICFALAAAERHALDQGGAIGDVDAVPSTAEQLLTPRADT